MNDAPQNKGKFAKRPTPRQQKAKRISPSYLENSALYYLQRFDSTAENLRRVLTRKVKRSIALGNTELDMDEAMGWINNAVQKMQRLGYVDDVRTATFKARNMFHRGTAPAMIRRKLSMAGAGEEAIGQAMDGLTEDNGDNLSIQAAIRLAKRRRLGPFRTPEARQDRRDKDLAALARSGFDLDTARQVIDADTAEDLLEILYGNQP